MYSGNNSSGGSDDEASDYLPGRITALNTQTRNPSRVSVFIDDVFRFGCYKAVALNCELAVGTELTPDAHKSLMQAESRFALREYLLGLIARRPHTAAELKRKAIKKEADPELTDQLIEEFREKKYIDESSYALTYARMCNNRKKWGPARIQQELAKRGIGKKTADEAISQVFQDEPVDALIALIHKNRKRFQRESDILKRRKKIFDHLSRKGHQPGLILQHLDMLTGLVDSEDSPE